MQPVDHILKMCSTDAGGVGITKGAGGGSGQRLTSKFKSFPELCDAGNGGISVKAKY
jgi:hypothetical protein